MVMDDPWVARGRLLREAAERRAEAEARRQMSLEIVSAGYRALAAKYYPDKGGAYADMIRLTAERDSLAAA
jgi:hypothetical protein